jgi:hypothetical protein
MGNATDKICRDKQNTYFIFDTFFSEKFEVYKII